jgi:5-formyltetrahydrofolate cyclo-ligase
MRSAEVRKHLISPTVATLSKNDSTRVVIYRIHEITYHMPTKEEIRQRIWALMQQEKVARFPGALGRIPNFVGAEKCARLLSAKPYWKRARALKANPDSPQRAIRQKALAEGKIVYVAVPRLRDQKPFIELDPAKLKCSPYVASSIKGAAQYGRLIDVDELRKIDLIVCGSVAVNRRGARVGKGGGYSDLEFGLLTENKKISAKTPIVTSVHALQIVDENLPMTEHDIPLSAIVTPDEVFETDTRLPRPKGIYWQMLADDKIDAIPVLKSCRSSS